MSELSAKAAALSVITAVEDRDIEKFDQAFKAIDDEGSAYLEKFLVEVVTGRYEIFRREDGPHFHNNPNFARAILMAWRRVGSARGKMAARMAFDSAISTPRRNK